MSNQDEDLLHGNDEDQPSSTWWSPSSPLTSEVTSITAFTIALISISTFGIGSTMLVAQSVLGAATGPSDLRALNLMGTVILLGMALGAILRRAEHCGTHRSAAPPRARRRLALTLSSLPT